MAIFESLNLCHYALSILIILVTGQIITTSSPDGSDDLISARCQSKCLYELEQRHKNDAEKRRLLRHQISSLCKEDQFCASCILPCRESLYEYDLCSHTLCRDTADPTHCRESCVFIEQIASKKPGQCPAQKMLTPTSECSAFCDTDSDCSEIEKCCSTGCSRTCLPPTLNDTRILPRPDGITVHERKRKRSAILRWVMKRLSPQHTATNSNLFVIQWRWSVHKQPETMTPWQTVMVRNKMYAILKHLLAPGRFYIFRVAAVNMHGSYGFSQPSHPAFKLSKEVKAPSAPVNLTVAYDNLPPKLVWNPPNSELPLKEYRLTWWRTSDELAQAFELRQRRHSDPKNLDSDDYEGAFGEIDGEDNLRKRSIVLPSYSTKAELDGLDAGQFYMVELYASVESSDGDLRGEPAILLIRTPNETNSENSVGQNDDPQPQQERPKNDTQVPNSDNKFMAELKTPYFESGRLKTTLSWFHHKSCNSDFDHQNITKFRVFIQSVRCLNAMPPQQFLVTNCAATLENLQFRCEYNVSVQRLAKDGDSTDENIARLTFSTLSCEQTPTDRPLKCKNQNNYQNNYQRPAGIITSRAEAQRMEAANAPQPNGQIITSTVRIRTSTPLINQKMPKKSEWRRTAKGEEQDEDGDEEAEEEWLPIEELEEHEKIDIKSDQNSSMSSRTRHSRPLSSATPQVRHELNCLATSTETAECSWNWPDELEQRHNPLIGFRTVLASTLNGSPSNVNILDAQQRRAHLTGLSPKAVYRFRLQAVTALGLGAELVEHFSTGHLAHGPNSKKQKINNDMDRVDENHPDDFHVHVGQFPNTIELPWGSSAFRTSSHQILLFLAFSIFVLIFSQFQSFARFR